MGQHSCKSLSSGRWPRDQLVQLAGLGQGMEVEWKVLSGNLGRVARIGPDADQPVCGFADLRGVRKRKRIESEVYDTPIIDGCNTCTMLVS
jgi:hypothetical protein